MNILIKNVEQFFTRLKGSIKVILIGILVYVLIVLLFGILFWVTEGAKGSNGKTVQSFLDCCYFSYVSFLTIGYGDIAPNNWGKLILFFESIVSITYTATFAGYLAMVFLKRPSKILISKNLYILKSTKETTSERLNFDLVVRLGNKGAELIDCKGIFELMIISEKVRKVKYKFKKEFSVLEGVWNLKQPLYDNEGGTSNLKVNSTEFYDLLLNPDCKNMIVRFIFSGVDSQTSQIYYVSKYYKASDIVYASALDDVHLWNDANERTPFNWKNFDKFKELPLSEKDLFLKELKK